MNIENIDIETLIPQRPPFVMVDCLTAVSPLSAESQFLVSSNNLFVDCEEMAVGGLVENIAQTCAARLGYLAIQENAPVRLGVIGSIRNFQLSRLPRVGEMLETRVEIKEEVFGVVLAEGIVKVGNEEIARTELKIALTDEERSTKC